MTFEQATLRDPVGVTIQDRWHPKQSNSQSSDRLQNVRAVGSLSNLRCDYRGFSLIQFWQRLHARLLCLAKALTLTLAARPEPACWRARVDEEAVADAWRRAARLYHDLYFRTGIVLKADGVLADANGERAILNRLDYAADAGTGRLDTDKFISLTERAKCSLPNRVADAFSVNVLACDLCVSATVIDASRLGHGLRLEAPLGRGDKMIVQFPGGRQLSGAVIWSRHPEVGIKLTERQSSKVAIFSNEVCRANS